MNTKNRAGIAINPKYIRGVCGVRYRMNIDDIIRAKNGYKTKTKSQTKIASDRKTLSRT